MNLMNWVQAVRIYKGLKEKRRSRIGKRGMYTVKRGGSHSADKGVCGEKYRGG